MIKPAANAGDVIDGKYTIVKLVGRGAMADVFEARDEGGRAVALKMLRALLARDPEAAARFDREVKVQQMIRHPHVAQLLAAGVAKGAPYLVMELLRGRSLATILRQQGRLEPKTAVTCAWQALHGLAATHAMGVLHRDLKPGNLVLEVGAGGAERVVLIDFGFASWEGAAGITQQGFVVGSLSYLAPERLRGESAIDERADLYALGCVLYELLCGRCPFLGDDATLVAAHLDETPKPPSAFVPDAGIPSSVDALVLKSLAKFPKDRAPSASEMAKEIEVAARAWRS